MKFKIFQKQGNNFENISIYKFYKKKHLKMSKMFQFKKSTSDKPINEMFLDMNLEIALEKH